VAFFFVCVLYRHKKVGVLADLVLVSTCEGDARVGEAAYSEAILGAYLRCRCDQLHSSPAGNEKGAKWRPKMNKNVVLS